MKWLKKGHQVKAVIQNYNDLEKSVRILPINILFLLKLD